MTDQKTRVRELGSNDYIQIKRAENGWLATVNLIDSQGITRQKRFIAQSFGELCEVLECFLAEQPA